MRNLWLAVAVTALAGIAGCASKEEPAKSAVAQAEAVLADLRTDAAQFAPQELQAAEAALAAQKQRLAKEDYDKVIEAQSKLATEVNALKEIVVAKQTQLAAATQEWQRLQEEVPSMITSIENQVEAMKGMRLPKEVTKETFETAKADLATMKSTWAEATAAFDSGNAADAADKGRIVEGKGKEVGQKLGMTAV